ncbi:MAG: relaxase/mobilization nuclease domain-containing protein [Longicatena sp.]
MAVTSIWNVKDNLKRVVDYTINDLKTVNPSFYDIERVLEYTTDSSKTEMQFFVEGINCNVETAFMEMTSTKQFYNKEKGILAFHAIQSFAPNEVTAETAHRIGVELAEQMWGERFEVVVSTHLDKEHYHNHFVINSVSFKDGLRYYDNKANYKKLRALSDSLCKKYSLSVISNPKKKGKHYAEWQADKLHQPTWRSLIRDDVEEAIKNARTYTQFIRQLKNMGYEVKKNVKHVAVRPAGKDRFIRLRSLSQDDSYDEQHIKERILENGIISFIPIQKSNEKKVYHYQGNLKKAKKITGFRALYFHYLYQMGILPKHSAPNKRVHFLLKEEILKMNQITNETTLLCKKKITTLDDLEEHESNTQNRLDKLIKERRCVYNKIRRCKNDGTKELLQKDITTLSIEIKALRKEVVLYADIKHRSITMKENLALIKNENKEKERDEHERRRRNR